MQLDVVSYADLLNAKQGASAKKIEEALLEKGIVGLRDVPEFINKSHRFVQAARAFSALRASIKQQYAPDRDAGDTEGYELGAEQFKTKEGQWLRDDKKASYYAFVPDRARNKWPRETDLQTAYLDLGSLIFNTGKVLLNIIGLNETLGLLHPDLVGYGRMLHYHKENDATNENPNWCGGHFDHGVFTGLMPAYYFRDGQELSEPEEAGLYIVPSNGQQYEKINADDKSVLLFQVGEFGQLISNDRIKATKHQVRKAWGGIERYTFALFNSAGDEMRIDSRSVLTADERYRENRGADGQVSYGDWQKASLERYRAG